MSEPPPLVTGSIILTALLLAVVVLTQNLSAHMEAYLAAPTEITTFLETCTDSTSENESYDLDIAQFPLLRDRIRLHNLYRTIQSNNDSLREELASLLTTPVPVSTTDQELSHLHPDPKLKTRARLLWRVKRKSLEERVRRGDMLRTRFLVQFLGLVASTNNKSTNTSTVQRDPEKWALPLAHSIPPPPAPPPLPLPTPPSTRPSLHHSVTEGGAIKTNLADKRGLPPTRRLTTQAMGHNSGAVGRRVRPSWGNVIDELQKSPLMHRRRESIEVAMLGNMEGRSP